MFVQTNFSPEQFGVFYEHPRQPGRTIIMHIHILVFLPAVVVAGNYEDQNCQGFPSKNRASIENNKISQFYFKMLNNQLLKISFQMLRNEKEGQKFRKEKNQNNCKSCSHSVVAFIYTSYHINLCIFIL